MSLKKKKEEKENKKKERNNKSTMEDILPVFNRTRQTYYMIQQSQSYSN